MIERGEKTEEYRQITPYWQKRIANRHYSVVELSLGYPKRDDFSRRMSFEVRDIRIGKGSIQLGAPKDEDVFIIMLGERLE